MRQTLDLVNIIGSGQFTRAGTRKIGQLVFASDGLARQTAIGRNERRVRRKPDTRLDADFIYGRSDVGHRRIGRQFTPGLVQIARLGQRHRRIRNQLVGPLEIVILKRRLIHLRSEFGFIRRIRLCRVEVLGPLGERGVERVGHSVFQRGVGIIPGVAAAGRPIREREHQRGEW